MWYKVCSIILSHSLSTTYCVCTVLIHFKVGLLEYDNIFNIYIYEMKLLIIVESRHLGRCGLGRLNPQTKKKPEVEMLNPYPLANISV